MMIRDVSFRFSLISGLTAAFISSGFSGESQAAEANGSKVKTSQTIEAKHLWKIKASYQNDASACTGYSSGINEVTTASQCLMGLPLDKVTLENSSGVVLTPSLIRSGENGATIAVLEVKGIQEYLPRSATNQTAGSSVVLYDSKMGEFRKESIGKMKLSSQEGQRKPSFLVYSAALSPSALGAPILKDGKVIGIHLASHGDSKAQLSNIAVIASEVSQVKGSEHPGKIRAYVTDQVQVRQDFEQWAYNGYGGRPYYLGWGSLMDEIDYITWGAAIAGCTYATAGAGFAPCATGILAYEFGTVFEDSLDSILQSWSHEISMDRWQFTSMAVESLMNGGWKTLDDTAKFQVLAQLVTYSRGNTVIYDEPYTYECKQYYDYPCPSWSDPFNMCEGWTYSVCSGMKQKEKYVPLPNAYQPMGALYINY